jgi:hypothetical protein
MTSIRTLALAGLAVIVFTGAAAAQAVPVLANRYYAFYQAQASLYDSLYYDRSGSRGRLGLGANPVRPEGPANLSD